MGAKIIQKQERKHKVRAHIELEKRLNLDDERAII
jgi:hypothetical protein